MGFALVRVPAPIPGFWKCSCSLCPVLDECSAFLLLVCFDPQQHANAQSCMAPCAAGHSLWFHIDSSSVRCNPCPCPLFQCAACAPGQTSCHCCAVWPVGLDCCIRWGWRKRFWFDSGASKRSKSWCEAQGGFRRAGGDASAAGSAAKAEKVPALRCLGAGGQATKMGWLQSIPQGLFCSVI